MAFEVISTNVTSGYSVDDTDQVTVLEGVSVTGNAFGLGGSPGADGILLQTFVKIFGTVIGAQSGIDYSTIPSTVAQSAILVGETGVVSGLNQAIWLPDVESAVITNHGLISGDFVGIRMGQILGVVTITNTGILEGTSGSAIMTIAGPGRLSIDNSGLIRGFGNFGADVIQVEAGLYLINSGTITTPGGSAVGTGTFSDTVANSGLIVGQVSLGGGGDLYNGSGSGVVLGLVNGNDGADVLLGGELADIFEGGSSNDRLNGRGGDDVLSGGSGPDTIFGGDGNDNITGGSEADSVNGNAGDDTITGDAGDDALRGGRDDDVIRGSDGDDTLRGDSGDDAIIGGTGRDDMFGGSGQDVFVFEAPSDSGTGAARDRIYDFRSGQDQLDLSGLAGPAFVYLGASNFNGTGKPEVRAVSVANGTLVYIDVNGDGTRDSDIYLIGTASVSEGDFLL